jgi:dTDP-4-amino-4,6-dideoxygalactose transaminase
VQAAIGLAALEQLENWTDRTRRHAGVMDRALAGIEGVSVPAVPAKRTHVYYQYCVYAPKRDELVVRCVRRGVDIETLHVDVCSDMDLFAGCRVEPAGAPGARRAAEAMQIPVYSTLTDEQAQRVARVVRSVLAVSR